MKDLVFLFDVDNTLLDNDQAQRDFSAQLVSTLGTAARDHYWAHYETLRAELGYADYLGALQRLRLEDPRHSVVPALSNWLLDYDFTKRLYPRVLEVVRHVAAWGTPVILSDGDAVFQPHKIARAGLWQAFGGNVLIHVHKEQMLDEVEGLYPARHYVMIDDKPRILDALKQHWGERVTTVLPRQGHYAVDAEELARRLPADISVDAVGDLLGFGRERFAG